MKRIVNRWGRIATVLGAALAFALTAAPEARAGHRNDEDSDSRRYHRRGRTHPSHVVTVRPDRRQGRHWRHHRHHRHHRHCGHRWHNDRSHGIVYGYGTPRHPRRARVFRVHEHGRYYCAPCRHAFRSRHTFHDHLHDHHHVPLWRLPFVIVHSALGWVFYG